MLQANFQETSGKASRPPRGAAAPILGNDILRRDAAYLLLPFIWWRYRYVDYIASSGSMIDEWWIGMDLKGIIHNLNRDTMSSTARKNEEIHEKKNLVESVCRSIFEPNITPILAQSVTATQASSVTSCSLADWCQRFRGTCWRVFMAE